MGKLDTKVAIVTGASRGIGKEIARVLAAEGCRIAICARHSQRLEVAAEELRAGGADVLAQPADVTDPAAVAELFDVVKQTFGRVDILVNNAGAFDGGRIDQLTVDCWDHVVAVCLTGPFLCSRSAFSIMKEQGGGRILNIGSISAQRPRENSAPYAAAKFGLWGLTQATAIDGRPFGIACGCLHPGNVAVERRVESDAPEDREPTMSVETIAGAALAMLTLPADINFLEAIVLPIGQQYMCRG